MGRKGRGRAGTIALDQNTSRPGPRKRTIGETSLLGENGNPNVRKDYSRFPDCQALFAAPEVFPPIFPVDRQGVAIIASRTAAPPSLDRTGPLRIHAGRRGDQGSRGVIGGGPRARGLTSRGPVFEKGQEHENEA